MFAPLSNWNRRCLLVATILIAIRMTGGQLYGRLDQKPAERQPPRLQAKVTTVDLGRVAAGDVVPASFPVRNRGGARLIIRRRSSSCTCAKARHPEVSISPGRKGSVLVDVDTAPLDGPKRFELKYETNDPARRRLSLVVLVDVEPRAEVEETPLPEPLPWP